MRPFSQLFVLISLATSLLFSAASWAQQPTPEVVIEQATQGVINQLSQLEVEERTEKAIRQLVLTWIIPAIDEQRVAMGALAKHWRSATPEQRQAFIELYRDLQIKTYGGAFKAFDGEKIVVSETVYNDRGDRAIVKTLLHQKDGNEIPVDFRLYQKEADSPWLVYDAVVAGLSLVKSYRDQLNQELQNTSLENFLKELSAKTQD